MVHQLQIVPRVTLFATRFITRQMGVLVSMQSPANRKPTANKKKIPFVKIMPDRQNATSIVAMTTCATQAQSLVSASV